MSRTGLNFLPLSLKLTDISLFYRVVFGRDTITNPDLPFRIVSLPTFQRSIAPSDQIFTSSSVSSSTTSSSLLPAEETASSGMAARLDLTGRESV